ncbi:MAG: 5'-nucleotidase C-terminal domain-containing protein [Desulfobacterales bacterium]|nr:5'-nucleotidase C-terminal domain-containing protein [Desulfobacterales bacterium]
MPPGEITLADIVELYPFENTVVIAEVTGKDIKSVLETSSRSLPYTNGSFLQTHGIEYAIDLSKPAQILSDDNTRIVKEGSRVKNIKVNGKMLDEKRIYKVALNDFIFGGGDGYSQFKKAKKLANTATLLQDLIVDYIKNNSPVSLEVKEKITIIKKDD